LPFFSAHFLHPAKSPVYAEKCLFPPEIPFSRWARVEMNKVKIKLLIMSKLADFLRDLALHFSYAYIFLCITQAAPAPFFPIG